MLRIHLPMKRTWVWSLVRKIPHASEQLSPVPQLLSLCSTEWAMNTDWPSELQLLSLCSTERAMNTDPASCNCWACAPERATNTDPASCNCWACAPQSEPRTLTQWAAATEPVPPGAHALQEEKPLQWEVCILQLESSLHLTATEESPQTAMKT